MSAHHYNSFHTPMQPLGGFVLPALPAAPFQKITDLIVQGSPVLCHYQSQRREDFLFYRVDGDLLYQRWLVCRVTFDQLLQYLDRKVSLQLVFMNPADGFLYSVDSDPAGSFFQPRLLPVAEVPKYYFPDKKSYYTGLPTGAAFDLTGLSRQLETGLLQISYRSHSRVGYGTIYLSVLAPTLACLFEMTNQLGHSYYRRWQETTTFHFTDKSLKNSHKNNLLSAAKYELIGFQAGSFGLTLKPLNQQLTLPGQESEADKFTEYFIDFIQASFDFAQLRNFASQVDTRVVSNYQCLLKLIRSYKLELQLQWANANSGIRYGQLISHKEALLIQDNITRLEYLNNDDLVLTGRFVALNVKNNNYVFESNEPSEPNSRGFIASALHGGVPMISFNKEYEVVVQRIEMKQAGLQKPKIKDLLISFTETEGGS